MIVLHDGVYTFGGYPGIGFCAPQDTVFHYDGKFSLCLFERNIEQTTGSSWSEKEPMPWRVDNQAAIQYNDTTALVCGREMFQR